MSRSGTLGASCTSSVDVKGDNQPSHLGLAVSTGSAHNVSLLRTRGQGRDDAVFVPYTTGSLRLFGERFLPNITVAVDDVARIEETEDAPAPAG